MSRFQFERLSVEDHFDGDGELEIAIEDDYNYCAFLPRAEVIRLRDHLDSVLGVAK